jgi:EAL domain-containing protein (putative c-di-GMP-specific phosphodiesterase class I)/GGDEF domain-containing protein
MDLGILIALIILPFIVWAFFSYQRIFGVPHTEFKRMYGTSPLPCWLLNASGQILEQNHSASMCAAPSQLPLFETANSHLDICSSILQDANTGFYQVDAWLHDDSGSRQLYQLDVLHLGRNIYLLQAHDRRPVLQLQKQWQQQLLLNPATGLPNRSLTLYLIEQALRQAQGTQSQLALLLIDWPEKSRLAQSFGDDTLALLLRQSAQSLTQVLPSTCLVLQPQPDQLLVLSPLKMSGKAAWFECYQLAEQLQLQCRQFHSDDDCNILLESCVGGVIYPDSAENADAMIHAAGQALWRAHKSPRLIQIGLFQPQDEQPWLLQSQQQLHLAIAQYQFELWFEPVYNLQNHELQALRVEPRWHSEHGLLQFAQYATTLEHAAQQVALERWMLTQLAELLQSWQTKTNMPPCQIKISAEHLLQQRLVEFISQLCADYPALSQQVVICLDESGWLLQPTLFTRNCEFLRKLGFKLMLTDVGNGISSLQLFLLPVWQEACLASTLVADIEHNEQKRHLCTSLIRIFASNHMTVTAIGLSTDMQTYLLQAIGVKCGAGIIQGSSVAANHVLDLLKTEMRQAARAPTL